MNDRAWTIAPRGARDGAIASALRAAPDQFPNPGGRLWYHGAMPTISQLERLLEGDPRDTFVLYALAQEHAKAGDHQRAVEFYERCVGVDPAYLYAYYHMARSLESLDRAHDAASALRRALAQPAARSDAKASGEIRAFLDAIEP